MQIGGINLQKFSKNSQSVKNAKNPIAAKNVNNSPKISNTPLNQQKKVDIAMTKDGSIMSSETRSRATVQNYTLTVTQNTPSSEAQGKRDKNDITDISNIDFDNLTQYSKTELNGLKTDLNEILNSDIDRSTETSIRRKLHKVDNAIKQASSGSSETEHSSDASDEGISKCINAYDKDASDAKAAQNAYEKAKNSLGGAGLIATLAATAKLKQAGDKTNSATRLMNSEQGRMEKQETQNEEYNEKVAARIEDLNKQQKADLKKQTNEEKKLGEEQQKIESTNAQVEEMQSSFSVDGLKTEEVQSKQENFNNQINTKNSSLQNSNTEISKTQRKISKISKSYKNNIKSSTNLGNSVKAQNTAYRNSINAAGANVTSARETAGGTSGISDAANKVSQASTMLGQSAISVGQGLQSNPYTKAAGVAMEKYGQMTVAAASITSMTSSMINGFAGNTNSASGVTQGAANSAVHPTNVTAQHSQRTKVQSKLFTTQTNAAAKSAKQAQNQTKNTFARGQKAISNTQTFVNNNFASRTADINGQGETQKTTANTRMTYPAGKNKSGINSQKTGSIQNAAKNFGIQDNNGKTTDINNEQDKSINVNHKKKVLS